jgi:hypothetical protein
LTFIPPVWFAVVDPKVERVEQGLMNR